MKKKQEEIVRLTLKLPKPVADYFRKTFPHGARSEFVIRCIGEYQHKKSIENIEDGLRGLKNT